MIKRRIYQTLGGIAILGETSEISADNNRERFSLLKALRLGLYYGAFIAIHLI